MAKWKIEALMGQRVLSVDSNNRVWSQRVLELSPSRKYVCVMKCDVFTMGAQVESERWEEWIPLKQFLSSVKEVLPERRSTREVGA